jgi:acyl-CoA synthetase (AMP-forming)/AMP-acid ligase II
MLIARLSRSPLRIAGSSVARSLARPLSTVQHLIPNQRAPLTTEELQSASRGDLYSFLKREGRWHEVQDKVAVRCATKDFTPLTFGELDRRISAAAHALRSLGFKQGQTVNIHLHNCEEYVVAFLAIAAIGGRASTSNPVYTSAELASQHLDSGTTIVLSSRQYADVVHHAVAESGSGVSHVSFIEDESCFARAPPTDEPIPALEAPIDALADIVALPYSSGTTGKPKGVMLSHHNLAANLMQLRGSLNVTRDDALIGVLPFFHIYGMVVIMMYAAMQQSELVLLPKFDPAEFLGAMSDHKVTVGFLVPPIILFLSKHPMVKDYDLSHLRYIMSGAAPLDAEMQQGLTSQLGLPIYQGWGMTELSPVGCTSPHVGPTAWGSAGTLCGSTEGIVIDPESGASLPPGAEGELAIRGPQVMLGYLGREEATAETIRADGFLRTGDLASYDESGNIFISDRLKELIKVKGFQVAPAELEGRLLEIYEVEDAAVIGVPDERAGELPKAFVVKKAGVALSAEGVRAALAEKLAEYKLPDQIEFVDAIPKSASGKTLRRMLK